jgi:hypothetical protein
LKFEVEEPIIARRYAGTWMPQGGEPDDAGAWSPPAKRWWKLLWISIFRTD